MNKRLLESIMKLNDDTGGKLAKYLGIARTTFSAKLNEKNGAEFNKKEIMSIKKKYSLNAKQIEEIFFAD